MKQILILLLLSMANTGALAAAEQALEQGPTPKIPAFIEQLDVLRQKANIPGLSFAMMQDQRLIIALGLSLANLETRMPDTTYFPRWLVTS